MRATVDKGKYFNQSVSLDLRTGLQSSLIVDDRFRNGLLLKTLWGAKQIKKRLHLNRKVRPQMSENDSEVVKNIDEIEVNVLIKRGVI